ncbi:MAG TPA: hypothetical protein PKI11_06750, partial [Candidatus Hydrogenedentes bacterium]|nr:hypothetical protein [Candidatus Hydrogenedentota bacterium]
TPRDSNRWWYSVASSADGARLLAYASDDGDRVFASRDSGVTWRQTSTEHIFYLACSGDGTRCVGGSSTIYTGHWPVPTNAGLYGDSATALELLYVGGGVFLPLNHNGSFSVD